MTESKRGVQTRFQFIVTPKMGQLLDKLQQRVQKREIYKVTQTDVIRMGVEALQEKLDRAEREQDAAAERLMVLPHDRA